MLKQCFPDENICMCIGFLGLFVGVFFISFFLLSQSEISVSLSTVWEKRSSYRKSSEDRQWKAWRSRSPERCSGIHKVCEELVTMPFGSQLLFHLFCWLIIGLSAQVPWWSTHYQCHKPSMMHIHWNTIFERKPKINATFENPQYS